MLPIYILNLDQDRERLALVAGQLAKLGYSWQRIGAVRGAELPDDFLRRENQRTRGRRLSASEIGCLCSHATAWRNIAEGDAPAGLVLEDDVVIAPEAAQLFQDLSWLPSDDCIVRLEVNPMPVVLGKSIGKVGRMSLHQLRSYAFGAAAYLLTRVRARALVRQHAQFTDIADYFMFLYPRENRVYQVTPAPFIQLFDYENDGRVKWPWQGRTGSRLQADTHKIWCERDSIAFFFKRHLLWVVRTIAGIGIDLANGYSYRKVPFLNTSRRLRRAA
jgi:glycosyl transferase family 25